MSPTLQFVGRAGIIDLGRGRSDPAPLPWTVGARPPRTRRACTGPTYANPTGRSRPDERRRALVEVAARTGTVLVEEDTYREITCAGAAPASLWSLAEDPDTVVRIGSFARSVAPRRRLGRLTAG